MNAGIAAVLGALVGVTGTGGAALVRALLGRSLMRLHIQAEDRRLLLAPRRRAYVAYVEGHKRTHDLISSAATQVAISDREADETYENRTIKAEEFIGEARKAGEQLERARAAVYTEGPSAAIVACIEAGKSLALYSAKVLYEVDQMPNRKPPLEHLEEIEAARDKAFSDYLNFLDTAYTALGDDLLWREQPGGTDDRRDVMSV